MKVGVKLRPSKTKSVSDPGHMAVYWNDDSGDKFRGYRFYVTDLPIRFQDSEMWRDYLFNNRVPGYVFDDIIIQDDLQYRRPSLIEKDWEVSDGMLDQINRIAQPRQIGFYSFNPDSNACDNCVTWASKTVNSIAGDVIPAVREGRIKLVYLELQSEHE